MWQSQPREGLFQQRRAVEHGADTEKRRKAKAQGEGGDGDLPDTVVNLRNEVMTRWKRERGPETIFSNQGTRPPVAMLQMTKKKM